MSLQPPAIGGHSEIGIRDVMEVTVHVEAFDLSGAILIAPSFGSDSMALGHRVAETAGLLVPFRAARCDVEQRPQEILWRRVFI
jgi:hypothetical protein